MIPFNSIIFYTLPSSKYFLRYPKSIMSFAGLLYKTNGKKQKTGPSDTGARHYGYVNNSNNESMNNNNPSQNFSGHVMRPGVGLVAGLSGGKNGRG